MYKTENMNIGMLNTVEDFLKDDSFIRYVLDGSKEKDSDWDIYYEKHPEDRDTFEEADALQNCAPRRRCSASSSAIFWVTRWT